MIGGARVVTSQFLRFHITANISRGARPVSSDAARHEYRTWTPKGRSFQARAGLVVGSAYRRPFLAALAPLVLFHKLSELWEESKKQSCTAKRSTPTCGSTTETARSLRESVSSGSYLRYFQKQDATMYAKILEAELYEAIVTFLDHSQRRHLGAEGAALHDAQQRP